MHLLKRRLRNEINVSNTIESNNRISIQSCVSAACAKVVYWTFSSFFFFLKKNRNNNMTRGESFTTPWDYSPLTLAVVNCASFRVRNSITYNYYCRRQRFSVRFRSSDFTRTAIVPISNSTSVLITVGGIITCIIVKLRTGTDLVRLIADCGASGFRPFSQMFWHCIVYDGAGRREGREHASRPRKIEFKKIATERFKIFSSRPKNCDRHRGIRPGSSIETYYKNNSFHSKKKKEKETTTTIVFGQYFINVKRIVHVNK